MMVTAAWTALYKPPFCNGSLPLKGLVLGHLLRSKNETPFLALVTAKSSGYINLIEGKEEQGQGPARSHRANAEYLAFYWLYRDKSGQIDSFHRSVILRYLSIQRVR